MSNLFNPENKVMVALGHVADYMILSFLWIFFSIPIFTIGASTTALIYASMKILSGEETYVSKDFWHSFKQNFKQATILWLIGLLVGIFAAVDIYFYRNLDSTMGTIGSIAFITITILYVIIMLYLFPYLSKFYCTNKQAIKNSLFMGIRHIGYTILMVVLDVVIVFVALYYMILLIFLPGILGLVNGFFFRLIFKKYIPEEKDEDPDEFTTIEEIEARDAELAAAKELAESESAEEQEETTTASDSTEN